MLCMLFLVKVKNVANGQTHIGGWVKNVTNGQTDKRTGGKNGDITDGRTDGLTESCFLR